MIEDDHTLTISSKDLCFRFYREYYSAREYNILSGVTQAYVTDYQITRNARGEGRLICQSSSRPI